LGTTDQICVRMIPAGNDSEAQQTGMRDLRWGKVWGEAMWDEATCGSTLGFRLSTKTELEVHLLASLSDWRSLKEPMKLLGTARFLPALHDSLYLPLFASEGYICGVVSLILEKTREEQGHANQEEEEIINADEMTSWPVSVQQLSVFDNEKDEQSICGKPVVDAGSVQTFKSLRFSPIRATEPWSSSMNIWDEYLQPYFEENCDKQFQLARFVVEGCDPAGPARVDSSTHVLYDNDDVSGLSNGQDEARAQRSRDKKPCISLADKDAEMLRTLLLQGVVSVLQNRLNTSAGPLPIDDMKKEFEQLWMMPFDVQQVGQPDALAFLQEYPDKVNVYHDGSKFLACLPEKN
jgi:hypothetical protein